MTDSRESAAGEIDPGSKQSLGGRERVGEIALVLKQARGDKALSLKEAAAEIRIPTHYLEILEGDGDPRFVSDKLYLVPFLRTYAAFLQLDPQKAVARFVEELHKVDAKTFHLRQGKEPLRVLPRAVFVSVLVTLLLVILVIWTNRGEVKFSGSERAPQLSSSPELPSLSEPLLPETPVESLPLLLASPTYETEVEEVPLLPIEPPSSSSRSEPPTPEVHQLKIQATEEAWILAIVDGRQKKDFLLKPGEAVELSAKERFVLTLGNAGGVRLVLDGKELPSPGISGQVIRNLHLPTPSERREAG